MGEYVGIGMGERVGIGMGERLGIGMGESVGIGMGESVGIGMGKRVGIGVVVGGRVHKFLIGPKRRGEWIGLRQCVCKRIPLALGLNRGET